jgi:hypothetical protein
MALELTIDKETQIAESFTVADGASIEKGTLMKLSDPNTVAASDGDADIIAGVLKVEKVASSGITQAAVWTRGVFKATAGGSITVGDALITNASTGAANELVTAGVNAENIVGRALETASDTHTFLFELNPQTINVA